MVCCDDFGKVFFELCDVTSDTADPAGIKAIFDVFPLSSGDVRDAEGNELFLIRRHRFLGGICGCVPPSIRSFW